MTNSYAIRPAAAGEAPRADAQARYAQAAYAAPSEEDYLQGYDEDGGSPALGREVTEGKMPDEIRTGQREPLWGGPRTQDIHMRRGIDSLEREDSDVEISTGWNTKQRKPNIGTFPEQVQDIGPSRPTAMMGPNTYYFTSPEQWAETLPISTGEHLSLADHRRKYEIYGMAPQGDVGVNTFRLDPKPWDSRLHYNIPRREPESPAAGAVAVGGNRSYRL